jgi:dTDP-4-dehydrorhamnose 3,5-epimerase
MNNIKCHIDGVELRELKKHSDNRGWLCELFRQDEIDDKTYPVMSYISMTKPGASRGPHEHKFQTDYICFLGESRFRIFLWDNRSGSSTPPERFVFESGKNAIIGIKIPPGVVHAYKNIGDHDGLVINAPDKLYSGKEHKEVVDEIRYEDRRDSGFIMDD